MSFVHGAAVWGLAAAWLGLAVLCLLAALRGRRALARLLGPGARLAPAPDAWLLAAALAVGVAWLGPQHGYETLRLPASGLDVAVLVDVSRSMDARDVAPSRLARARRVAAEVLRRLRPGDRAALAAFAGQGVLLTPLTHDEQALRELLPALDTGLFSDAASRMRRGLEATLPAFADSGLRPRAVLVLSDGEGTSAIPAELEDALRRAEVRVLGVAIGSEAGASIEVTGQPLRDAEGKVVITHRELGGLEALARASDGALFVADRWGDVDVTALVDELRRDARPTAEGTVERRVARTWHALPAGLALALLLAELLLPPGAAGAALRRGLRAASPRRAGRAAAVALAVALVAPLVAATPDDLRALEARIRDHPGDVDALLALGAARAAAGDLDEAERAFLAASVRARRRDRAALAAYDLGVAALERGELERARDRFFDALALDPHHERARFNLEWTLVALERKPPPPSPGGSKQAPPEPDEKEEPAEGHPKPRPSEASEKPTPRPSPRPGAAPQPLPTLDARAAARWLEAVEDDPRAALRSATAGGPPPRPGPQW